MPLQLEMAECPCIRAWEFRLNLISDFLFLKFPKFFDFHDDFKQILAFTDFSFFPFATLMPVYIQIVPPNYTVCLQSILAKIL